MRQTTKFSDDWHRFYRRVVLGTLENRHMLKEIEAHLGSYEAVWHEQPPFDFAAYSDTDSDSVSAKLTVAAANVELLQRVILCRSIHLIRAFVESINRDDFDTPPFLVRAVLEQAALGAHAIKRIRGALAVMRREGHSDQCWQLLLSQAQLSTLFGAKVNFRGIIDEFKQRLSRGEEVDSDVDEVDVVMELIEQGRLSAETNPEVGEGLFRAKNIIDLMRDLSAMNPQQGAPPGAIEQEWEYLSQYCHPSVFAWAFDLEEIFAGGRSYDPALGIETRQRKALATFVGAMWRWGIFNLPAFVLWQLSDLESEIVREAATLKGDQ